MSTCAVVSGENEPHAMSTTPGPLPGAAGRVGGSASADRKDASAAAWARHAKRGEGVGTSIGEGVEGAASIVPQQWAGNAAGDGPDEAPMDTDPSDDQRDERADTCLRADQRLRSA